MQKLTLNTATLAVTSREAESDLEAPDNNEAALSAIIRIYQANDDWRNFGDLLATLLPAGKQIEHMTILVDRIVEQLVNGSEVPDTNVGICITKIQRALSNTVDDWEEIKADWIDRNPLEPDRVAYGEFMTKTK